jgi:hypothetical protein
MGPSIVLTCGDVDLEGLGSDYSISLQVQQDTANRSLSVLTCNGNMCFCKKILALVCTAARTLS